VEDFQVFRHVGFFWHLLRLAKDMATNAPGESGGFVMDPSDGHVARKRHEFCRDRSVFVFRFRLL
jgi:hypothetical protein